MLNQRMEAITVLENTIGYQWDHRLFASSDTRSQTGSESSRYEFEHQGEVFHSEWFIQEHWKTQ